MARNPFGTVPAFEHDGFKFYETSAVVRYIDQVFPGPKLTPDDARDRARMNQIISIVDCRAYSTIIWKIVIPRVLPQLVGGTDESVIAGGLPKTELCLKEFDRIKGGSKFLAGDQVSADLYVAPIIAYLALTPEAKLLAEHKGLSAWWEAMTQRSSFKATQPNFG